MTLTRPRVRSSDSVDHSITEPLMRGLLGMEGDMPADVILAKGPSKLSLGVTPSYGHTRR